MGKDLSWQNINNLHMVYDVMGIFMEPYRVFQRLTLNEAIFESLLTTSEAVKLVQIPDTCDNNDQMAFNDANLFFLMKYRKLRQQ